MVILWILGSIYDGIAAVTESAVIGVLGAMTASVVRGRLSWAMLQEALGKTMMTVGTIIWLVLGTVSFVGIYSIIGDMPPLGVTFVMMGMLIIPGTFMEWIAIAYITVTIFAPVVASMTSELGLAEDAAKIWFGILFVMNIQIYLLSPSFGPARFWLKSAVLPALRSRTSLRRLSSPDRAANYWLGVGNDLRGNRSLFA